MYGKNQWKGREVEGRYSDLMTFFVRELDFTNKNSYGLDIKNLNEYPHYYFTIEFMKKSLKEEHYLETLRWILDNSNSAVTIEANEETLTAIKPDLFNRCHVIYRISDPYLEMLKATDTLSIDAGWYRVHQIMKCNLMEINPDDYKFDRIKE